MPTINLHCGRLTVFFSGRKGCKFTTTIGRYIDAAPHGTLDRILKFPPRDILQRNGTGPEWTLYNSPFGHGTRIGGLRQFS